MAIPTKFHRTTQPKMSKPTKRPKVDTAQSREKATRLQALQFLESPFRLLKSQQVTHQLSPGTASAPNMSVLTRSLRHSYSDFFTMIVTDDVVTLLLSFMNRRRDEKLLLGHVSTARSKYYKKAFTVEEFKKFYGMTVLFENTYSNEARSMSKLRAQYQHSTNKVLPIGIHRYSAWMACLSLSLNSTEMDEFFSSIRTRLRAIWHIDGPIVIDECIYSYQVGSETKEMVRDTPDQIPVVYIPRKPHPNGLMNYKLVVTSAQTKLPFMADFLPHISFPRITPRDAMMAMISRCHPSNNSVFVVDSGFGSCAALRGAMAVNAKMICALSSGECSYVWELLKRGVKKGQWNACGTTDGIMLSLCQGDTVRDEWSGAAPFHLLGTNCFRFETDEVNQNNTNNQQSSSTSTQPELTEGVLMRKKVVELKQMCTELTIPSVGKKKELIMRILKNTNNSVEQQGCIDRVISSVTNRPFSGKPPHHDFYRAHFNGVDRHDRYFYRCCAKFKVNQWQSKMILSVLTDCMVNAWVLKNEFIRMELPLFRRMVAEELIE